MPPGPTSSTSASAGRVPCQGRTMASGTWAATSARTSGSVSTVTRPAPTRRAPRAESTAAPLMPRLPARMATCPKLPLWASQALGGRTGRSRSCRAACGGRSRGMGTTVISPQASRAGIRPWQTLWSPKQAVRVARTASPGISAALGSRPEGRSRASTGKPEAFRARTQARAGALQRPRGAQAEEAVHDPAPPDGHDFRRGCGGADLPAEALPEPGLVGGVAAPPGLGGRATTPKLRAPPGGRAGPGPGRRPRCCRGPPAHGPAAPGGAEPRRPGPRVPGAPERGCPSPRWPGAPRPASRRQ